MKGFVFIQGGEIPLRFFCNHAFKDIEREHEIIYVPLKQYGKDKSNAGLDDAIKRIDGRIEWLNPHPFRVKQWKELFDVSCVLYKDKSPSFDVRQMENHTARIERYKKLLKLARPEVFSKYRINMENELGVNPDMLDLTLKEQPDFFILPSTLLDRLTDDVLQLSDKLNIPTLLLTAGWDNLSSKGILHRQPAAVGVWGEQTREHAISVQNIDRERVFIVGAPHYDNYKQTEKNEKEGARQTLLLPGKDKKIILFAGTLRLFDETAALKEMEEAIEKGELQDVHIVYRPHPERVKRETEDNFSDYSWKHVSMDPEMSEYYEKHKRGEEIVPDNYFNRIEYLIKLYRSVDAVITPMSSILLESMIFGIPVMAIAFSDGKHSWSADKVSRMMHFKEIYEIPEVVVCRDRNKFLEDTKELFHKIGNEDVGKALRASSEYFVQQGESAYSKRILEITKIMLANIKTPPIYNSFQLKYYLATDKARKLVKRYATADLPVRIARRLTRMFTAKTL